MNRYVPACCRRDCKADAAWLDPETETVYCEPHSRAVLMQNAEDRKALTEEWATEDDLADLDRDDGRWSCDDAEVSCA